MKKLIGFFCGLLLTIKAFGIVPTTPLYFPASNPMGTYYRVSLPLGDGEPDPLGILPIKPLPIRPYQLDMALPIYKNTNPDPIRFSMVCNKDSLRAGEEFTLTIRATWADLPPALLFYWQEQLSFALKVVTPLGFVQTGGDYYDFIGTKLDEQHREMVYTLKGKMMEGSVGLSSFTLLRGVPPIGNSSLFEKKSVVNFFIKNDKPVLLTEALHKAEVSISAKEAKAQKLFTTIYGSNGVLKIDYNSLEPICPGDLISVTASGGGSTINSNPSYALFLGVNQSGPPASSGIFNLSPTATTTDRKSVV